MRRALLVGINQYSQPNLNLNGCVNDIRGIQDLLIAKFGFKNDEIKLLLDFEATAANIRAQLTALVTGLADGDTAVFYFAGHGVEKGFNRPGEETLKDQAIVPHDISYSNLIVDDDLYTIITSGVGSPEIGFTAIYDCCHSGTMIRAIEFDETGEPQLVLNRCFDLSELDGLQRRAAKIGPYNTLSACGDLQTAADLKIQGTPRGAFSYALQTVLRESPDSTIANIGDKVLSLIQGVSKHPQIPEYYRVKPESRVIG